MANQNKERHSKNADNLKNVEGYEEIFENLAQTSAQFDNEYDNFLTMFEAQSFEGSLTTTDTSPQNEEFHESETLTQEEVIEEGSETYEAPERAEDVKIEIPDIKAHEVSFFEFDDFEVAKKSTEIDESDFILPDTDDKESTKSRQVEEDFEMLLEEREEEHLWEDEEEEGEEGQVEEVIPFFVKRSAKKERIAFRQIDTTLSQTDLEEVTAVDDEEALFRELLEREELEKAARKMEEERRKRREVRGFIEASGAYELIAEVADACVEKSEQIDSENILRVKLDKAKIIRQIKIILAETEDENKKRYLFSKRIFDHFRRKKYKRALFEDDPTTLIDVMKRYRDCLVRLDKAQTRQKLYKFQMATKLRGLENSERDRRKELEFKTLQLRALLKEVGSVAVTSKGPYMQEKEINKIMGKLILIRNEISKLRLKYIKKQHKFCSLQQEVKELEDLGSGMKVVDFEQMKAETFNLSCKVEERNNEITRLNAQCQADTHLLAHIREKQAILFEMINKKGDILNAVKTNLASTRNYLNNLKITRDAVRKEYQELSFNCGLLDKPHLLRDYDATLDEIKVVKSHVEYLKKVKQTLLTQLNKKLKNK